jgi:hypothetical protein
VPQNPYTLYADFYTYDYSRISLRYYTGPRNLLETASDTEANWTWTTASVQVADGQPFIDVELVPSLKTGTSPYLTYSGYQTPIVRIYLKYCPDSWLNVSTSGDGAHACCLGWQRANSAGVAQLTSTNTLGWWNAGQAENGVSQRPIVDFRQGSAGSASAQSPSSRDGSATAIRGSTRANTSMPRSRKSYSACAEPTTRCKRRSSEVSRTRRVSRRPTTRALVVPYAASRSPPTPWNGHQAAGTGYTKTA